MLQQNHQTIVKYKISKLMKNKFGRYLLNCSFTCEFVLMYYSAIRSFLK